ncbi:hypothetical protein BBI08_10660 [Planococcus halocryophilus]|uniref:Uncharacterized protein n=1 Tax=Planococcus halocryophilus TaxID=1215089 RepID=A0A1C7DSH4_9BACL|nr:hypothetical protein BBI08_10660 [Planococcus halocryophilus]
MTYDPRIWQPELDTTKSESARGALTGIRRTDEAAFFCRTVGLAYDPKSWALELDTTKSEGACSAPTGIRQTSSVALFATQQGCLMSRGARHLQLDTKSEGACSAPTFCKVDTKQKAHAINA